MELEQLIAELMKVTDKAAVVQALQNKAQPIFQAIFDRGHSEATTRHTGKVTELETKVTDLTTQLTQSKEKIETLSKDKPDLAALQAKHDTQIATLQGEHKTEVGRLQSSLADEKHGRQMDLLRTSLTTKHQVDPDYAELIVSKPEVRARIKANSKGQFEVLRPNSEIPVVPGDKQTPLDVLALELVEGVPAKFKSSNVDRGSQISQEGAAAGTTFYDAIRADTKKHEEERAKNRTSTIESRLGMSGTR